MVKKEDSAADIYPLRKFVVLGLAKYASAVSNNRIISAEFSFTRTFWLTYQCDNIDCSVSGHGRIERCFIA